jgi:hypothetical protein
MVFGGTRDRDDLTFWSTLTGDRDEPADTLDPHGRTTARTSRKTAVLSPAQIANLPAGRVLVIRRGLAPVIGRTQMIWQRPDRRRQAFAADHPELMARLDRCAGQARAVADRLTRRRRRTQTRAAIGELTGRPALVVVDAVPDGESANPTERGGAA